MSDQTKNGHTAEKSNLTDEIDLKSISRRTMLKAGAAAAIGLGMALSPLRKLQGAVSLDEVLQQHYTLLTPEMMQKVLARLEKEIKRDYGVTAHIKDYKPVPGAEYAYALNLSKCIGCRRCVYACMKENNTSQDPQIQYIRVLEMKKGAINVETSDHYYNSPTVPDKDYYYMPVQCHQCKNPPCVKACPVKATWQEPDGIIVVDYNWCIGCRYCMAACPYWARRFNYTTPSIPRSEITTEMAYLGNRIRPRGVVEKCTFCIRRVRQGLLPACAEACPTGSRIFSNIRDPESPMNYILRNKRVYILKEEAQTIPRFYYFFEM
jgi:Fe-S-cluster-containing dehydrogenase component